MLIFSLLAIVIVINFERVRKRVPQELGDKSIRNAYHRTGSVLPAGRIRAEPSASRGNHGKRTDQAQPVGLK